MRISSKHLSLFVIIAVAISSCSYLRNTPSYREQGRERFGTASPRSPEPSQGPPPGSTLAQSAPQVFYTEKSQKLGYTLNGDENPELLREIVRWLGTPYRYGGTTAQGMDCSGFAQVVYRNVYNIDLERITVNMAHTTRTVNRRQLREGDLVFFKIDRRRVSHVGIYISNNKFAHASSSRGVVISDLNQEYYATRFAYGGRVRR